jgi:hypothetical protein
MAHTAEVPEGYRSQPCDEIGLVFPSPDNWHTWYVQHPGREPFYFITNEMIPQSNGEIGFQTGMSVGIFRHVGARSLSTSVEFARRMIEGINDFEPTSDVRQHTEGPFTTYSRTYTFAGGEFAGGPLEPTAFHIGTVGNEAADTAHIATFQTPLVLWDTYGEVAKTMTEGVRPLEPIV